MTVTNGGMLGVTCLLEAVLSHSGDEVQSPHRVTSPTTALSSYHQRSPYFPFLSISLLTDLSPKNVCLRHVNRSSIYECLVTEVIIETTFV
jgi:hypothetical protein